MFRRRQCDNPPPQNGGRGCPGAVQQQDDCNTHLCRGWLLPLLSCPITDHLEQQTDRQTLMHHLSSRPGRAVVPLVPLVPLVRVFGQLWRGTAAAPALLHLATLQRFEAAEQNM